MFWLFMFLLVFGGMMRLAAKGDRYLTEKREAKQPPPPPKETEVEVLAGKVKRWLSL
jgi:hypothetical protein